jgi:hypothetical protein
VVSAYHALEDIIIVVAALIFIVFIASIISTIAFRSQCLCALEHLRKKNYQFVNIRCGQQRFVAS